MSENESKKIGVIGDKDSVLGFLAAAFFGAWRVKRAGLCVEDFTVIAALGSGMGLLGGVLLFAVVTYTPAQAWALLCAGEFRQLFGGIVFYGALLAGLLGGLLGSRLAKADLRDYINPVAPALPLGHAIGRVGCFLTGCCYGRPTESCLGVVFSHPVGGAPVGVKLLPVDSEHSAIFQCLQDKESAPSLTKILLTASGGPFFGMKTEELRTKTKADALKHPNWNMGAKITIDSATLMNKGLELIEAVWLFGLPPEKIQIVVQRQSIVHSAVQFSDHSVIAQLGVPDMRIPIQYALTYPARVPGVVPELDFTTLKLLTFDVADEETFRCLAACKKAIKKGGLGPCAANGANEEAVKLFLEDKIGFLDIGRLVEAVVDSDRFGGDYTLSDVYECDRMAREFVRAHL